MNNAQIQNFSANNKIAIAAVIVGGAALYFVPKFLKAIKDAKEKKEAELASKSNPWSFNIFLDWSKVPAGTNVLTYQQALDKANAIYKAMDAILYESEEIAIGIIVALPSKLQVAQVAKAFSDNHGGSDLLTFLKEGVKTLPIASGLSDDQYNRVIQNVSRKSKY